MSDPKLFPGAERGRPEATDDKAGFVKALFSRIAPRYDLMNQLMSLGRVGGWRATVGQEMELPLDALALDVGTGTGELARRLAKSRPEAKVIALDSCAEMLRVGKVKLAQEGLQETVPMVLADALALPFAEGTFDGASNAFVLRNVADLERALAEMCRVVRSGGRVVSLELARPRLGLLGRLYDWYVGRVVPLVGGALTGARWAYDALLPSLDGFPAGEEMAALMQQAGFREVSHRSLFWGVAVIYVAVK